MITIEQKRGSGKTSLLLQLAALYDATFVCGNEPYARMLMDKMRLSGQVRLTSYKDFANHYRGRDQNEKYVVDDFDCFLRIFMPYDNIIAITESKE